MLFASHPGTRIRPAAMFRSFGAMAADIHEMTSVASAVAGAFRVVNAVSFYVARRKETFHTVHVAAAQRLAK